MNQVDFAAGDHPVRGDELVDRIRGQDHEIEGLAGLNPFGGIHPAHRFDADDAARALLVGSRQLGQHLAGGHRRNSPDRGGHAAGPCRFENMAEFCALDTSGESRHAR